MIVGIENSESYARRRAHFERTLSASLSQDISGPLNRSTVRLRSDMRYLKSINKGSSYA